MILLRTFERAQEVREDSSSEWLQDASAAVNQPAPGDAALAEAKRQLRERGGELDALIKSREGAKALRAALRDAELPDWMSGMRSYGHASEAAVESRLDESVPFLAAACNTSAASFKFRPQQREALRASLSGRHVVCEWPTGHGKTMAIAGPSLAAGGITLVLCPLQAMLTALVASLSNCQAVGGLRIFKLEAHHNDPKKIAAERAQLAELRGHQGAALVVATLHKASGGDSHGPTALLSTLEDLRRQGRLRRICLDEVHLLADDKADEYRLRVARVRHSCGATPVSLLSAVPLGPLWPAIREIAGLADETANVMFFRLSCRQHRIFYDVTERLSVRPSDPASLKRLLRGLDAVPSAQNPGQTLLGRPGILFVPRIADVDDTVRELSKLKKDEPSLAARLGNVDSYYSGRGASGMDAEAKREVLHSWREGKTQVVVSTSALSHAEAHPNVEWVAMLCVPSSPVALMEQAGRIRGAGACFISWHIQDLKILSNVHRHDDRSWRDDAIRVLRMLDSVATCRKVSLERALESSDVGGNCGLCDVCLELHPGLDEECYAESEDISVPAHSVLSASKSSAKSMTFNQLLEETRADLSALPFSCCSPRLVEWFLSKLICVLILKGLLQFRVQRTSARFTSHLVFSSTPAGIEWERSFERVMEETRAGRRNEATVAHVWATFELPASLNPNESICSICAGPGLLICCATCPRAFHRSCLPDGAQDRTGASKWKCPDCIECMSLTPRRRKDCSGKFTKQWDDQSDTESDVEHAAACCLGIASSAAEAPSATHVPEEERLGWKDLLLREGVLFDLAVSSHRSRLRLIHAANYAGQALVSARCRALLRRLIDGKASNTWRADLSTKLLDAIRNDLKLQQIPRWDALSAQARSKLQFRTGGTLLLSCRRYEARSENELATRRANTSASSQSSLAKGILSSRAIGRYGLAWLTCRCAQPRFSAYLVVPPATHNQGCVLVPWKQARNFIAASQVEPKTKKPSTHCSLQDFDAACAEPRATEIIEAIEEELKRPVVAVVPPLQSLRGACPVNNDTPLAVADAAALVPYELEKQQNIDRIRAVQEQLLRGTVAAGPTTAASGSAQVRRSLRSKGYQLLGKATTGASFWQAWDALAFDRRFLLEWAVAACMQSMRDEGKEVEVIDEMLAAGLVAEVSEAESMLMAKRKLASAFRKCACVKDSTEPIKEPDWATGGWASAFDSRDALKSFEDIRGHDRTSAAAQACQGELVFVAAARDNDDGGLQIELFPPVEYSVSSGQATRRVMRRFGYGRFLRVGIGNLSAATVRRLTGETLSVAGRQYRLLCCKPGVLHFFAESSDSSSRGIKRIAIEHVLAEMMPQCAANLNKPAFKACAYLELSLSLTRPTVELDWSRDITLIPDHERGECFTDGCGFMREGLGRRVADQLSLSSVPSAFQARIGGAKGMFLVLRERDYVERLGLEKTSSLAIRHSQVKYDVGDAPHACLCMFEVVAHCKADSIHHTPRLYREIVPVLEASAWLANGNEGVLALRNALLRMASEAHSAVVNNWADSNSPQRLLERLPRRCVREDEQNLQALLELLSRRGSSSVSMAIEAGDDRDVASQAAAFLRRRQATEVKELFDFKIPLQAAVQLYMIPDPFGVLGPGEVAVRGPDGWVEGPVALWRSPSYQPEDVVVATAVACQELDVFMPGIIFINCSDETTSMASRLSNGDFDGDTAWCVYERDFVDSLHKKKGLGVCAAMTEEERQAKKAAALALLPDIQPPLPPGSRPPPKPPAALAPSPSPSKPRSQSRSAAGGRSPLAAAATPRAPAPTKGAAGIVCRAENSKRDEKEKMKKSEKRSRSTASDGTEEQQSARKKTKTNMGTVAPASSPGTIDYVERVKQASAAHARSVRDMGGLVKAVREHAVFSVEQRRVLGIASSRWVRCVDAQTSLTERPGALHPQLRQLGSLAVLAIDAPKHGYDVSEAARALMKEEACAMPTYDDEHGQSHWRLAHFEDSSSSSSRKVHPGLGLSGTSAKFYRSTSLLAAVNDRLVELDERTRSAPQAPPMPHAASTPPPRPFWSNTRIPAIALKEYKRVARGLLAELKEINTTAAASVSERRGKDAYWDALRALRARFISAREELASLDVIARRGLEARLVGLELCSVATQAADALAKDRRHTSRERLATWAFAGAELRYLLRAWAEDAAMG